MLATATLMFPSVRFQLESAISFRFSQSERRIPDHPTTGFEAGLIIRVAASLESIRIINQICRTIQPDCSNMNCPDYCY
jgi:hypothetical protein